MLISSYRHSGWLPDTLHKGFIMNMKRLLSLLALAGIMSTAHPLKGFEEADSALRLLQIATIDCNDSETLRTVTGMVMANKLARSGGQVFNSIRRSGPSGFYDDTQRGQPSGLATWSGVNVVSSLADTASLGHDWLYYKNAKSLVDLKKKVDIKKKGLWAGLVVLSYILANQTVVDKIDGKDTGEPGSLGSALKNYLAPALAIAQRYLMWKEQQQRVEMLNCPHVADDCGEFCLPPFHDNDGDELLLIEDGSVEDANEAESN